MKLESFDQNKKNKKFIIKFLVVGLVITAAIVASSYALYEKRETIEFANTQVGEFVENDVTLAIKIDGERVNDAPTGTDYYVYVDCDEGSEGDWDYKTWSPKITNVTKKTRCSINYNTTASIQTLASAIGSTQTTMDGILENDIDKLVGKEQGLGMIIKNDTLLTSLKSSSKYTDEVKQKILNSTVVSEDDKYDKGLPCYLFNRGFVAENTFASFILRFCNYSTGMPLGRLPCSSFYDRDKNYIYFGSSNIETYGIYITGRTINLTNYKKIELYFETSTDCVPSGETTFGISDSQVNEEFIIYDSVSFTHDVSNHNLNLDVSLYNDDYYLKLKLKHGGEITGCTARTEIIYLALY